jgi:hypothetical protein
MTRIFSNWFEWEDKRMTNLADLVRIGFWGMIQFAHK